MSLNSRGSTNATEWAQKRKDQIERARILRDERKNGAGSSTSANALQGAGQEFVHQKSHSNNGRSQQQTPHSQNQFNGADMSILSSPGIYQSQHGNLQTNQTPNGYRQYTGVSQELNQEQPSRYNSYLNNQGQNQSYMRLPQNSISMPITSQSYSNSLNNGYAPRTQDHYYPNQNGNPNQSQQPQYNVAGQYSQQQIGVGLGVRSNLADGFTGNQNTGLNTIQYPNVNQQQRSYQGGPGQNGGQINQQMPMRYSGGFGHDDPSSRNTQMMTTNYSSQDVQEAQGNLQLLKKRMVSNRDLPNGQPTSMNHSTIETDKNQRQPKSTGNRSQYLNNSQQQQYSHAPKPPRSNQPQYMDAEPQEDEHDSNIRNKNYRKVFKPQSSENNWESVQQTNDLVLNGGRKPAAAATPQSYQPERKEPPVRQVQQPPRHNNSQDMSNQINMQTKKGPLATSNTQQNQYNSYDQQQYSDNPFGQQSNARVANTNSQQSKQIPYKPAMMSQTQARQQQKPPTNPKAPQQQQHMNEYPSQNQYDPPAYAGSGHANAELPDEYGDVGRLIECGDCGRKFNEQAIQKHRKICKKVFVEKRKAFDIAEHRKATDAAGKGLEEDLYSKKMRAKQAQQAPKTEAPAGKIPKWKLQSMQLRKGIGAVAPSGGGGNGAPSGYGGGGKKSVQQQQYEEEEMDDRILCKFCGRKFNENAAARHIAFCETKSKKDQMKTGGKPQPAPRKR